MDTEKGIHPRMRFIETDVPGAWIIEAEPMRDSRGFFQRTFCEREFAAAGLATRFPQHSTSWSERAGTVRGLHFQAPPHAEAKVVACCKGAIFDVIVDLRRSSPAFGRWISVELSSVNGRRLYVPKGVAHGFQTLVDDAEVAYLISAFYAPDAAGGVRFDDPRLRIAWPLPVAAISERDMALPRLDEALRVFD